MAGEYNRELSQKVFAGQCRLVEKGFHQGGPAGYGLRRALIDEKSEFKAELSRGPQKSIQTDRVILIPGPEAEIEVVQRIYHQFIHNGMSEREIAHALNAEGLVTDFDRPWSRGSVHQMLTNEKYIGNNVYNKTSSKLRKRISRNPPDKWVRCDGAFQGIVSLEVFAGVREIILQRHQIISVPRAEAAYTRMRANARRLPWDIALSQAQSSRPTLSLSTRLR